jgi:hypothetical protein
VLAVLAGDTGDEVRPSSDDDLLRKQLTHICKFYRIALVSARTGDFRA